MLAAAIMVVVTMIFSSVMTMIEGFTPFGLNYARVKISLWATV